MTDTLDLDALEAGLEGVTPGEWFAPPNNPKVVCVPGAFHAVAETRRDQDAAFIASVHNNAPELIRLARLGLEAERLRAALLHWQSAHRSGKHEPCVIAFEHARTVLDSLPTPPTGGENV